MRARPATIRQRQDKAEGAAYADGAFGGDAAAVQLDEVLAHRQAQAGATAVRAARPSRLGEHVEDGGEIGGGDAQAGVGHGHLKLAVEQPGADADLTRVGEADSVTEQVQQHLADARGVHLQGRQVLWHVHTEGDAGAAQQATRRGDGLFHDRAELSRAPA